MATPQRKGARSLKDIPEEVLQQLNNGTIESVNLTEWLAVDQRTLLKNILAQYHRKHYLDAILNTLDTLDKQTVNTINEAIGTQLFLLASVQQDSHFLQELARHPADLVRCWATYFIGRDPSLTVPDVFRKIQFFAADSHFGVREIAWLSIRSIIANNIAESISILSEWTSHPDANLRRFASEATRPRGVWCAHIETLKQNPSLGIPILEPLRSDTSRYVQDSVGNWLNDASKTQPHFVTDLCRQWEQEPVNKATSYIIKKAMRTIQKTT